MKRTLTFVLILSASISLNAQWKKVKGNGKVTTIERSTEDYDEIAVGGFFDVELVDGQEGQLTLKGEENLLEYIKTEVKNGKLVVKVRNGINLKPSSWSSDKSILVTIPVEEVSAVSLSGSGDVIGKTTLKTENLETALAGSGDVELTVEATNLTASMSGSGDMKFKGKATNFDVSISGSGDINAYDLEAEMVDARISGSADIKVTANQSLRARVSGSGDISYRGNPDKIDTKTSGSGDISKG